MRLTLVVILLVVIFVDDSSSRAAFAPVDGEWGKWKSDGGCSVTCGEGQRPESRACDSPPPAHNGEECEGSSNRSVSCFIQDCPVDGEWGKWKSDGGCSVTCGEGQRPESRACDSPPPAHNGEECEGSSNRSVSCFLQDCPVDGNWGPWSDYDECSVTCGWGIQRRYRECNDPAPAHGGHHCHGGRKEKHYCYTEDCPEPARVICRDEECGNHGVYEDGICYCDPGFTGSMCEIDLCADNTCGNPDGCCRIRPVPESPGCGETCVGRQQLNCIYTNCHATVCDDHLATCYDANDSSCILLCSQPSEI